VLEPLHGYLRVAEHIQQNGPLAWEGWNFGPENDNNQTVEALARQVCKHWGPAAQMNIKPEPNAPHEAALLKLDSTKSRTILGWRPRWNFEQTIQHTVSWYRAFAAGADMREYTLNQIEMYRACETQDIVT
jgi:CDP-glucose 4,6-dehydratase